jgi:hypothetical protein
MIKLEHVVLASPEQMKFIIEGMRNPMNSWEKSDSRTCRQDGAFCMECEHKNDYCLGENDHSLMQRLSNAGTDHRKFMRTLPVYVRITAPLYWWKEFDTYKVGTVANSCSTMHKIQAKEFTMDDFSCEHIHIRQSTDVLKETIDALNVFRDVYLNGGILSYENGNQKCYGKNDKEIWWQMIQLLPSSYNQTRNVMMNRIAVFCANSEDIDELSFRQMVDNHYRETYYCHDYLKAGHKKLWWYIEQNDYNLYYCQNHVYAEYKNIGGDSNG